MNVSERSAMRGFDDRWQDFPDYILGITREIWEDRGISLLNRYYSRDIPLRTPMGIQKGNRAVIESTGATVAEFPDREILGQDVIWSDHPEHGLLSSHRVLTMATHTRDGQYGKATGRKWSIQVIADCAARDGVIYDEWLVRDHGGLVRQLGHDPRDYAASRLGSGFGSTKVFTPATDIDGGYHGRGNDNEWGATYASHLSGIMDHDFNLVHRHYDRAVIGNHASARTATGREEVIEFWLGLRSSFPDATFRIHHQIGMDGGMLPPRAALRWSLDGKHTGWGAFGRPSGANVHVMGISHAEFGPRGLRRECALYDEVAIWTQILQHMS